MTVVKQEYCCVRPMRYLGSWSVVQGGCQHRWKCDKCHEYKITDDLMLPHVPGGITYVQHP